MDAPPGLARMLGAIESVDNYSRLRVADDFAHQLGVSKSDRDAALLFLAEVLADERISNSDIKGFLNRTLGRGWSVTSPFGANAKAARQYVEAVREAIVVWDGWLN